MTPESEAAREARNGPRHFHSKECAPSGQPAVSKGLLAENRRIVQLCYLVVHSDGLGCRASVNSSQTFPSIDRLLIDVSDNPAASFPKLEDSMAQAARYFWQAFCPKQNQHKGQDQDYFSSAEIEWAVHNLHRALARP